MDCDTIPMEITPSGQDDIMALKDNDILMRNMIEHIEYLVRILDAEQHVIYMNKSMRERFDTVDGEICHQVFLRPDKCEPCVVVQSWNSGKPEVKDVFLDDRYYKLMSSPVLLASGEKYAIEMFYDVTEQKTLELELTRQYQKLTSELNLARNIQDSILPVDNVYWNTFRLSTLYLPAEVLGGDLFDIIKLNDRQTLLYIADVSGHGVRASMLTMFLREMVRGKLSDAVDGMQALMKSLLRGYADLDIDSEIYLSTLLCCYDKVRQELSIVNAGHNCFPLIVRRGGTVDEIAVKGLPISKLGNRFEYEEVKTPLLRGERLVLYTDGIIEEYGGGDPEIFATEDVKEILRQGHGLDGKTLAKKIVNAAMRFPDAKAKDDRAIMIADVL
jgi:sigma-B regulation protein RsbU (phosphoserine phosphatase)